MLEYEKRRHAVSIVYLDGLMASQGGNTNGTVEWGSYSLLLHAGSSLFKRSEELARVRDASEPITPAPSFARTICHEEKWF
jgi:hypothetical protein